MDTLPKDYTIYVSVSYHFSYLPWESMDSQDNNNYVRYTILFHLQQPRQKYEAIPLPLATQDTTTLDHYKKHHKGAYSFFLLLNNKKMSQAQPEIEQKPDTEVEVQGEESPPAPVYYVSSKGAGANCGVDMEVGGKAKPGFHLQLDLQGVSNARTHCKAHGGQYMQKTEKCQFQACQVESAEVKCPEGTTEQKLMVSVGAGQGKNVEAPAEATVCVKPPSADEWKAHAEALEGELQQKGDCTIL